MPSAAIQQLMKTDRRKQWKALKDKHAKAISKAKLDFDQKLGPALDKYQTQVDKLTKLAATVELTDTLVNPVFESVQPLKKIVIAYQSTIKALEDPAKKELGALLTAIEGDIKSWTDLTVNTMGTVPKTTTDEQKQAARALNITCENIRAACLMIVTRGPRAKASYEKPNLRPYAIAVVNELIESARVTGSASHEMGNLASQVIAGSNYELFKARAKAFAALATRTKTASAALAKDWNFVDDKKMTISSNTDAMALFGKHQQITSDIDHVLAAIQKMP